jgi:hypothetical protein
MNFNVEAVGTQLRVTTDRITELIRQRTMEGLKEASNEIVQNYRATKLSGSFTGTKGSYGSDQLVRARTGSLRSSFRAIYYPTQLSAKLTFVGPRANAGKGISTQMQLARKLHSTASWHTAGFLNKLYDRTEMQKVAHRHIKKRLSRFK